MVFIGPPFRSPRRGEARNVVPVSYIARSRCLLRGSLPPRGQHPQDPELHASRMVSKGTRPPCGSKSGAQEVHDGPNGKPMQGGSQGARSSERLFGDFTSHQTSLESSQGIRYRRMSWGRDHSRNAQRPTTTLVGMPSECRHCLQIEPRNAGGDCWHPGSASNPGCTNGALRGYREA
jgi:hypothetical protein